MKTDTALTLLPEDISTEPYAVALPRGDWAFRLAVNTALAQTFRSGEILNIFTKRLAASRSGLTCLSAPYISSAL